MADGCLREQDKITTVLLGGDETFTVQEVGLLSPSPLRTKALFAGQVMGGCMVVCALECECSFRPEALVRAYHAHRRLCHSRFLDVLIFVNTSFYLFAFYLLTHPPPFHHPAGRLHGCGHAPHTPSLTRGHGRAMASREMDPAPCRRPKSRCSRARGLQ